MISNLQLTDWRGCESGWVFAVALGTISPFFQHLPPSARYTIFQLPTAFLALQRERWSEKQLVAWKQLILNFFVCPEYSKLCEEAPVRVVSIFAKQKWNWRFDNDKDKNKVKWNIFPYLAEYICIYIICTYLQVLRLTINNYIQSIQESYFNFSAFKFKNILIF